MFLFSKNRVSFYFTFLGILGLTILAKANPIDSLIKEQIKIVDALRGQAKLQKAMDTLLYLRAEEDFENGNCESKGNFYHKLGVVHLELYNDNIALHYLRDSALTTRIACIGETHIETANTYYVIAMASRYLNQQKEEEKHLLSCLKILESLDKKNFTDLAEKYHEAGNLYAKLGDYSTATSFFQSSFSFYEKSKNVNLNSLGKLYNDWGVNYRRIGNNKAAIKKYELSKTIYKKENNQKELARVFHNLGNANYELGKYKIAEKLTYEALSINNSINNTREIANNTELLGQISYQKGDFKNALKYHKEVLARRLSYLHSPYYELISGSYENLADVYLGLGQWNKAIENYQQSIHCLVPMYPSKDHFINPKIKNITHQQALSRVLALKADALIKQPDLNTIQDSILCWNTALNTYKTLDTLINQMRQSYQAAGSKYHLAEKTSSIYENAIEVALKLYDLSGQKKYWDKAYYFCAKNKAIILLEGMEDESALKFAGIRESDLQKEQDLQKAISNLVAEIYDAQRKKKDSLLVLLQEDLFEKKRAYDKLKKQFEKEYKKYYQLKYTFQSPLTSKAIQNALAEDQLLIEYFLGANQLFIFVISKNNKQHYTTPLPDNFQDTCLTFRQLLNTGVEVDKKKLLQLSYYLYQKLLEQPLLEFTAKNSVNRLIIIPDNSLLQISFDGLLTAPKSIWKRKKPYLVYKYAIGIAYSNQLIFNKTKKQRIAKAIENFVGFGLEYDDYTLEGIKGLSKKRDTFIKTRTTGKLLHADDEVEEAAALFNGQKFLNQDATKQNFFKHALNSKIIHFSGHGIVDESSPLNSALVFSRKDNQDFLFRASEFYNMPLNAELAVLSACNTGAGKIQKGEGIRSLARAISYAGCSSLLVSLWNASDSDSKEIVLNFFQELQKGIPKDIALQKAKILYLKNKNPENTNSFYWSHLTLLGDSSPIEFSKTNRMDWRWVLLVILLLVGVGYKSK